MAPGWAVKVLLVCRSVLLFCCAGG